MSEEKTEIYHDTKDPEIGVGGSRRGTLASLNLNKNVDAK